MPSSSLSWILEPSPPPAPPPNPAEENYVSVPPQLTGYVLVPPRVGGANSRFTLTPNVVISSQSAFDSAYPSDESAARSEYMVQVLQDGSVATGPNGALALPDATFAWTKNEGIVQDGLQVPFQRFDYSGQDQRFVLLRGAPREFVGTMVADANTNRFVVKAVPQIEDLMNFRARISIVPVGSTGSGSDITVSLVDTFGSPPFGTVEMNAAGELNWDPASITGNLGRPIYFQRQAFYTASETDGSIGSLSQNLWLNPLPSTGQLPAIRIGERAYLTAIQRAQDAAFSTNPASGTVEWSLLTGRLKFNSSDIAALGGQTVYYDGVFLGTFQVPATNVGLAQGTPCGTLATLPSESSDVYFRIPSVTGVVPGAQFAETVFVDSFDATGKQGQVQIRRGDGAVQLSAADRAAYTGLTVQVVLPDVTIERGVSLRLFRSPVNPDGTAGVKDVTAMYAVERATLAEPIVEQPFVFLPALPREDETLTVRVAQGNGSFVGELLRLDVASPPVGKGFTLDLRARQLAYAERKSEILPVPAAPFSQLQLPGAPVHPTSVVQLELENTPGAGDFVAQVEGRDFTIDHGSGVITQITTNGYLLISGTATSVSGSVIQVTENLLTAGVQSGDTLVANEALYAVTSVTASTATVTPAFPAPANDVPYEFRREREVLADRFFREVPPVDPNTRIERIRALGTVTNSPRLRVNPATASRMRFRYGKTNFSASVVVTDSGFTIGPMGSGEVEIDRLTGEINFSALDVAAGGTVYSVQELLPGIDYRLQPALGFIEFAERMLEREEVLLHYVALEDDGSKTPVVERGAFFIPKEVVQPHPAPTSVLSFNPAGREVATSPAPRAYRGGRPQAAGRVAFDTGSSTVSFQPDGQVTDALPHGPIVGPSESVYVDYYVLEALGGESNLTVARPPMATAQVVIAAGATAFKVEGDRTLDFQAGLLEIDRAEVYLIGGSSFDGAETTVSLDQSSPQVFASDLNNPVLKITSGVVRRFSAGVDQPSYFVTETAGYDVVPRGAKQVRVLRDQSRAYTAGTVVAFTDSGYQEYYKVEGSTYDAGIDRTVVALSSGTLRQYAAPTSLLRTVRAILSSSVASAVTTASPILSIPVTVYRRTEGQAGRVLVADVDYTIDASGRVTFTEGLGIDEELGIFYAGARWVEEGRRTRASWTFTLVPNVENGLAEQVLEMDYTTYAPDTFFWRVETMTNFRAEMAADLTEASKAASPSQGPVLENSGDTPLYEQGNPSLFFEEGDLANQDLVARHTLVFYNNLINSLESYFEGWDGRAVGDHDGRFLFDGKIDNPVRTHFAYATNQIDDLIQVFGSTTKRAFEAAPYSRFYPTQKTKFGAAEDPAALATGDPILDLEEKALRAVASVKTRTPWAVTTAATVAGATVFQVDHAQGNPLLLRPGLNVVPGLKVAITTRDGTVLVPDNAPATVASTTPTSVTLSAPVAAAVPKGSTIRMASQDDVYRQVFALGVDVGVNMDSGFLTHVDNDDVPVIFIPNSNPTAGMPLDVVVQVGSTGTAPARFPALDGGILDDDGNRQFPILGGGGESSVIADELGLIAAGSGSLAAVVSPSFVGSGTVTDAHTLEVGVAWSAPVPKVGDLVRILTGGASDFHRITAVTATTVSFEPDLFIPAGAVTFEITTGPVLASGVGTLSTSKLLDDASGDFVARGVKPGFTMVITSGAAALIGQRRQVAAVTATQITLEESFGMSGVAVGYDVVNSLATYGGTSGSLQDEWVAALDEQLRVLEGHAWVDFEERILDMKANAQATSVNGLSMGTFSTLLVFVATYHVADSSIASVTFADQPLTALYASTGSQLGVQVYLGQGLAGVAGNLVVTATSTGVDMNIKGLKLSAVRHISPVVTASTVGSALTTSGVSAVEAGDLVVSLVCAASGGARFYSADAYETFIPKVGSGWPASMLTASRATEAGPITKAFRVNNAGGTTRAVTLVFTKDHGADVPIPREVPERLALRRFIEDARATSLIPSDLVEAAEAALKEVEAAIVNAGRLRLQFEYPIPVYRSSEFLDSAFLPAAPGVVRFTGARARPISSLLPRQSFLSEHLNNAVQAVQAIQNILSAGELYDARFAWIDGRINLETGILPKKGRAILRRQKALENIVTNLTRLLTM